MEQWHIWGDQTHAACIFVWLCIDKRGHLKMSITLRIINVSYNVQYMYLDEIHINLKLETVTSKFSSVQERFSRSNLWSCGCFRDEILLVTPKKTLREFRFCWEQRNKDILRQPSWNRDPDHPPCNKFTVLRDQLYYFSLSGATINCSWGHLTSVIM